MSERYKIVGKSVQRKDSYEIVKGERRFSNDINFPNVLHVKVLRSPHPRAKILDIKTEEAKDLPGVVDIITHKNVPDKIWEGCASNYKRPVLNDTIRYAGEEVAAVAAETEEIAERALNLIEVEYETLEPVLNIKKAMKEDSPRIRPEGNVKEPTIFEWGDINKGFEKADHIVELEIKTGQQQHAPLQRNSAIAKWSKKTPKLTLWTSTQNPSILNDLLSNYFGLSQEEVRVITLPVGGSFGLWWELNFQFIISLLAKRTERPVRLELSRAESFLAKRRETGNFSGRLGLLEDGTFTAIQFKYLFDNGAYGNKPFTYGYQHPYKFIDGGKMEFIGVSTNRITSGCMRGVGTVTATLFVEQLVDKAAEKINMNPVKIRLKNYLKEGEDTHGGIIEGKLSTCALDKCLEKGAELIEWNKKWKGWEKPESIRGPKRRGIGLAVSYHRSHGDEPDLGTTTMKIRINSDGTVRLFTNLGRMGQGVETAQAQIVSEELGVPIERIEGTHGDSQNCPWNPPTVASLSTRYHGLATRAAARDAKEQLLDIASKIMDEKPEYLDTNEGRVYSKKNPEKSMSIKEILTRPMTSLPGQAGPPPRSIIGRAWRSTPPSPQSASIMAHFAEVEVDIETGKIKIIKFVPVHDSGKIINPKIAENQIIGGATMGIGFALTEELVFDEKTGAPINPNFTDYKILGSGDIPDFETLFVEEEEPTGTFGAKGVGEAAHCASPAAVVNAVYNAIGKRIDIPLTPTKVREAIEKEK